MVSRLVSGGRSVSFPFAGKFSVYCNNVERDEEQLSKELKGFASDIGLDCLSSFQLSLMCHDLWCMKYDTLDVTPLLPFASKQAQKVSELYNRNVNKFISEDDLLPALFLTLFREFAEACRYESKSELNAISDMESGRKQESKKVTDAISITKQFASNYDFDPFLLKWLDGLAVLARSGGEIADVKISHSEFESLEWDKVIQRLGHSNYGKTKDFRWHVAGVFSSILYKYYFYQNPNAVEIKNFGKHGNVTNYNSFLRKNAEGFLSDSETKSRLDRIKPRPENIEILTLENGLLAFLINEI